MFSLAVFVLYSRAITIRWVDPFTGHEVPQRALDAEWWPKALDWGAMERLLTQQPRLMLAFSVVSLLLLGLAVFGIALTFWTLWSGQVRAFWSAASRRIPAWSWGELWRTALLAVLVAGVLPFTRAALPPGLAADPHLWATLSMLWLDGFVILMIVSFAAGKGTSPWWRAFGLPARRPWASVGTSVRAYVMLFPWVVLLLTLITEAFRRLGWRPPIEPIQELLFRSQRPSVLWLTILLACVVGPIAEELFFRGVLYAAVRRKASRAAATLVSGAAFALLHTNAVGFVPILILGCLFANLYERTGSILAPLSVHVLHNTILMSVALVFRQLLLAA